MKHIGLFAGIGGFELAARWMGWKTIAWCEWTPFCQKVLKHHFPKAKGHGDIKTTDFTIYRGQCDILTGGFPCQPYSTAGKRLGKDDDRHLWPEMLRAIREISPCWIVGENVRGLTNWNGGVVFDEVQADLEAEGYEVIPFLLPACAVNAPHRRDRIWFVAHALSDGHGNRLGESGRTAPEEQGTEQRQKRDEAVRQWDGVYSERTDASRPSSLAAGEGFQELSCGELRGLSEKTNTFQGGEPGRAHTKVPGWSEFPTQSPVCFGDDGISAELDAAALFELRETERSDPFTIWRTESLKSYGNAIVPQVAYQIYQAIEQYESLNPPPAGIAG